MTDLSEHDERTMVVHVFQRSGNQLECLLTAKQLQDELGVDFWDVYRSHREWLHENDLADVEPITDESLEVMRNLTDRVGEQYDV